MFILTETARVIAYPYKNAIPRIPPIASHPHVDVFISIPVNVTMVTYNVKQYQNKTKITSCSKLSYKIDTSHRCNEYKLQNSAVPSRILIYTIDLLDFSITPSDDEHLSKYGCTVSLIIWASVPKYQLAYTRPGCSITRATECDAFSVWCVSYRPVKCVLEMFSVGLC
jgi:hypothetical protein